MKEPKQIKLEEIADVIYQRFKGESSITCYMGSNAATPTASIEALTSALKQESVDLPFMKMVHILLQGPVPYVEKGLMDKIRAYSMFSAGDVRKANNEGRAYYLPCTLANLDRMIGQGCHYQADMVIVKVRRNEFTGEYSLGLSVEALHTAISSSKLVIAEHDPSMPFTQGQSILEAGDIDYIIEDGVKPVFDFPAPDFENLSPEEKRIGELITEHYICDGATLQVGIGKIPDAVVGTLCDSGYKDLGAQTELYGDGLMMLQKKGIINNRKKKLNTGYSTTSLIMGSRELYDYVHMRSGVQMRPCLFTNAMETVRRNAPFISVNTAMGVDLYGNIWADFIDPKRYYGGVGGQPDFVRALSHKDYGTPIIAIKSTTLKGASKIVRAHPPGISLTASGYDGVVVVTEYGIADLRELPTGFKALAIASISHPDHREELLRSVYEDPMMTKPKGYSHGKTPRGVIMYDGKTSI